MYKITNSKILNAQTKLILTCSIISINQTSWNNWISLGSIHSTYQDCCIYSAMYKDNLFDFQDMIKLQTLFIKFCFYCCHDLVKTMLFIKSVKDYEVYKGLFMKLRWRHYRSNHRRCSIEKGVL